MPGSLRRKLEVVAPAAQNPSEFVDGSLQTPSVALSQLLDYRLEPHLTDLAATSGRGFI
jgi:hypothetical protein